MWGVQDKALHLLHMQGGRAGGGAGDAISGPARFHLAPLTWRHPPPVLACTHPPKCGHGRSVRPATKQLGATVGQGSPPLSSPGICVTFRCFRETASRQQASENLGLGCAVMGPRPERQARALDCPKACIWLSMRRKEVKRCRKGAGCVANPMRTRLLGVLRSAAGQAARGPTPGRPGCLEPSGQQRTPEAFPGSQFRDPISTSC